MSGVYLRTMMHKCFMLRQQARKHNNKWQFQKSQSTVRKLNNETQLLLHRGFTKAWQNLQQGASIDYYILLVFVCSISYTTACKNMYRVILPSVACPSPHCTTLSQKTARFSKKCNWTLNVLLDFPSNSCIKRFLQEKYRNTP